MVVGEGDDDDDNEEEEEVAVLGTSRRMSMSGLAVTISRLGVMWGMNLEGEESVDRALCRGLGGVVSRGGGEVEVVREIVLVSAS